MNQEASCSPAFFAKYPSILGICRAERASALRDRRYEVRGQMNL